MFQLNMIKKSSLKSKGGFRPGGNCEFTSKDFKYFRKSGKLFKNWNKIGKFQVFHKVYLVSEAASENNLSPCQLDPFESKKKCDDVEYCI